MKPTHYYKYLRKLRGMIMGPKVNNSLSQIDSIELANYILASVGSMNHLKLQKLIYYVEAYHLAYFEQSLIEDEFEAWLHGPVSRKIWDYYKNIANVYDNVTADGDEKEIEKTFEQKITEDQKELIQDVLEEYGKESAYRLECMTHAELPWQEARRGCAPDDKCEEKINKKTMQSYYKQNLYQ
jgi:uncharacterized phage-associated protein